MLSRRSPNRLQAAGLLALCMGCIPLFGCDPLEEEEKVDANARPSLDINPGSISFEAYSTDGLQTRTLSLQNHGTDQLVLSNLQIIASTGAFTIVEGVNEAGQVEVTPRSQQWITIAWDPSTGDGTGALQMNTNDPLKPGVEVELSALVQTQVVDPDEPVTGDKVDVYLLLDVAYNYSCYHPELDRFIDDIIDELYATFGDVAVGFGVYDDYRVSGWATVNGPYEMRHAISTNHDSVKAAADRLRMEFGGSDEGSAYEAIFQAVWGAGYDQDCDGAFDLTTDIQPWHTHEDDAFAGAVPGLDNEFPAEGSRRGVGWREGATHIVIYSVDNIIRDTAMGSELPAGSCGAPATVDTVARALAVTDTRLLGINVYEWQGSDPRPQQQLEALAVATESYIDSNDDGLFDDPAVLAAGWNWPQMSTVMHAVEDLMRTAN
ncbi:MAG: hypothetical protein CL927_15845 [Deltaproteobacteria bacterium]|nr:hypothetical protein [Deltaproteobacteria bacterium]HCH65200.1 hypothetical protein [Deltaproteobacteria bacterium]